VDVSEAWVSVDQTQQVIDRYFEVMGAGDDFSQFYVDESDLDDDRRGS
jgi:hypothetical protein